MSINIDGVEYVRADSVSNEPQGDRYVMVIDGGWIYAGDLTQEGGRIKLRRAVMVGRWTGGQWFDGVLNNPTKDCEIRRITQAYVDFPLGVELFRIPVDGEWGL